MDQFEFHYREEDDGFVFPVTVHPDVCGHPHGLMMLERYVTHILYIVTGLDADLAAESSKRSTSTKASSG